MTTPNEPCPDDLRPGGEICPGCGKLRFHFGGPGWCHPSQGQLEAALIKERYAHGELLRKWAMACNTPTTKVDIE